MRSRLYWQIYRAVAAVGLLVVVVFGAIATWNMDKHGQPPEVVGAVEVLLSTLPPQDSPEYAEALEALGERLDADLTVWSQERVVGSTRRRVPPGERRWERVDNRHVLRVSLADGRRVGLSSHHPAQRHRHLLVAVCLLAVLVAVGSFPLARRMTRRLEDVRAAVQSWGPGTLDVRAPVEGEDEVAEVATAFNQAADRVVELVEGQRRMLASTSHELRSPLTRVRMALELMDDDAEARDKLIADAIADIEELDTTVGELLDVGRLQGHGIEGEPVALLPLAQAVAGQLPVTGVDSMVMAEPRLLRRALRNLVDNARRHGGGVVELEVQPGRVLVRDRGPGIPESEAERIFEPFHRAAGHAEGRDGGVGLGLWLVREIAHAHGGRVGHQPRAGGGTEFSLEIPLV